MFAIAVFFDVIPSSVLSLLGYSASHIRSILYDPVIMQIRQIVFSFTVFFLPFILVFKLFGFKLSQLIEAKKPKEKTFLHLFLVGISFCSFSNLAVGYAGNIFESFGIDYNVNFGDRPSGIFGFLLVFISSAVMPALAEEFACRGLVMGSLRRFGEGFAILASAILFGIMHGNFEQIPFAFLVGLAVGFAAVKSQSIWTAVAIHSFNNFVSVFFSVALAKMPPNINNLLYCIYLIVSLLCGILGLLMLSKKENAFSFEGIKTRTTKKQKYSWYFLSVPIIIFCAINLIEACSFF